MLNVTKQTTLMYTLFTNYAPAMGCISVQNKSLIS